MNNLNKVYAEKIAEEYAPKKESKVLALKKLDQKVKRPANIFTFTFGIIGALVFGTGMSLAMKVIGGDNAMLIGIIVGVIGMIIMGVNYPIYKKILQTRKNKYSFEITELAKEIVSEE